LESRHPGDEFLYSDVECDPQFVGQVLYQRFVEETPEAFGNDLLSARYTLANILDGLGRHDEAAELRRQIGGDAAPDDG